MKNAVKKAARPRKYTKEAIKKDFRRNGKIYLMAIPAIICLIPASIFRWEDC